MDVVKEGDLLLGMFQKEFKKMHSELVDKEVRLFHHIFHHLFATRLAKLEQFLQHRYDEFSQFEPNYAPINSTNSASNSSSQQRPNNNSKSAPHFTVKEELEDYEDEVLEEEPFYPGNNYDNEGGAFDIDNFIPINDSDDSDNFSDSDSSPVPARKRRRPKHNHSASTVVPKPFSSSSVPNSTPGKKGRKRHPIWEEYDTTFAENGKIISNDCRHCHHPVSAKAWRMQMHLIKCTEIQKEGSLKLSRELQLQLKRFQTQLKLEQQQQLIHKEKKGHIQLQSHLHVHGSSSSPSGISSISIPSTLTSSDGHRSSHNLVQQHTTTSSHQMQQDVQVNQQGHSVVNRVGGSHYMYQEGVEPPQSQLMQELPPPLQPPSPATPMSVPPNFQNFPQTRE